MCEDGTERKGEVYLDQTKDYYTLILDYRKNSLGVKSDDELALLSGPFQSFGWP